jgi:predicted metal-dependent phosphoesterase TrpH
MGLADLHVHTTYSWDGTMTPAAALQAASLAGLDVIAITDHDEIRGAYAAQELAGKYGVEVIPGIEINTADGHLLALFVHELVPAGLSLRETLDRIGAQGGLAIAAHPAAPLTPSLGFEALRQALADPDARKVLHGIEVYNGGLPYRRGNARVKAFAGSLRHPLAWVGNSDAHYFWAIGLGVTHFPGQTADGLREALVERKTSAHGPSGILTLSPIAGWIGHYLLRKLGWVTSHAVPQKSFGLSRQFFTS